MSVKNATNFLSLSLRGAKRRGNLESGLPRYARSDRKEGNELVAWFDLFGLTDLLMVNNVVNLQYVVNCKKSTRDYLVL